jgi:hypothetical protein
MQSFARINCTGTGKVCSLPAIPAAATATAATLSASAAPGAFCFGAGLIHVQCAPSELCPVQRSDGFFPVLSIGHFHEAEPSGASGVAVGQNGDPIYLPIGPEKVAQFIFRDIEVEIPNENILHANFASL